MGRPIKTGYTHHKGYRRLRCPSHPRAHRGYVLEHILVAEKALGHLLPEKAVLHHHDGNKLNNANSNLVICENQTYHTLLHQRMRVFKAGGDPDAEKFCCDCKELKPINLFSRDRARVDGLFPHCKQCWHEYHKVRRQMA